MFLLAFNYKYKGQRCLKHASKALTLELGTLKSNQHKLIPINNVSIICSFVATLPNVDKVLIREAKFTVSFGSLFNVKLKAQMA